MSDEFTDDDVTTDNIIDMHTRQKRPVRLAPSRRR